MDPLLVDLQDLNPRLLDGPADGPVVDIDHPPAGDQDPPQLGEASGQKLVSRSGLDQS